ncbi:hypothetical protein CYLTODRAFT_493660 [Cylindrobasidium torrendii FP15055 ss-10]|uniref:F-box domain-containing protein n=1 Tax=Cylindrobasidium torrendii FP15055 ss-10 TaxID=1314674 RepID=A0A0D7B0N4_9AGAR|nr:hypothetical protein CYLTODRAFT_493660 [Cylindrobasidium torrendii FP15055 ss-10]
MAPIDTIPDDVLRTVFELCCATETRYGYGEIGYLCKTGVNIPFQHTILRVSRRWMDVVTHAPNLWTSLDVGFLLRPKYVDHFVRSALRWSGDALLDIKVSHCRLPEFLENIFLSQSRRWRTLELELSQWSWTWLQHSGIPFLESLNVTGGSINEQLALSGAFVGAPALRRLTCPPSLVVHVAFPWNQIVELDVHVHEFNAIPRTPEDKRRFFDILAIAPLRTLASNDPPTKLASTLCIPRSPQNIHRADASLTTELIPGLVRRSGCTLTHLDILDVNPTHDKTKAFEALLKAVPQLQELDLFIISNMEDEGSLSQMLQSLYIKDILPELRTIRMKFSSAGAYAPEGYDWRRVRCMLLHVGLSIIEGKRKAFWCMKMNMREVVQGRVEVLDPLDDSQQMQVTNGRNRLLEAADAMRIDLYLVE